MSPLVLLGKCPHTLDKTMKLLVREYKIKVELDNATYVDFVRARRDLATGQVRPLAKTQPTTPEPFGGATGTGGGPGPIAF